MAIVFTLKPGEKGEFGAGTESAEVSSADGVDDISFNVKRWETQRTMEAYGPGAGPISVPSRPGTTLEFIINTGSGDIDVDV